MTKNKATESLNAAASEIDKTIQHLNTNDLDKDGSVKEALQKVGTHLSTVKTHIGSMPEEAGYQKDGEFKDEKSPKK